MKIAAFSLYHLSTLAQTITNVTMDQSLGGIAPMMAKLFWFGIAVCVAIVIFGGIAAVILSLRQQEIPYILLVAIVICLLIPAFCFIFGRMVGLGPALDYFTQS